MNGFSNASRVWIATGAIVGATALVGCDRAQEGGTTVTPPATSALSTPPMTAPMPSDAPAMGSSGTASAPAADASAPGMGSNSGAMAPAPAMGASEPASAPSRP